MRFFIFFFVSLDCTIITMASASMNANGFHLIWFLHNSFRCMQKPNSTMAVFLSLQFLFVIAPGLFFVIKLRLFHQIAQILTYRENCMMWTSFLVRASSFDSIQFNSFWFCCLHTQTIAISNWEKWSTFGIYSCCERSVACKNHDCSFGSIIYGVLINNNEYTHTAHSHMTKGDV